MTPQHLQDYIKIYEGFVQKDICLDVCKSLEKADWETHSYYDSKTNTLIRYENELSIAYDNIAEQHLFKIIINEILHDYVGNHLKGFGDWYAGWNGFTEPRFNKYNIDTLMRVHCDHIHSIFDGSVKGVPVLTVLGALNTGYSGGEFVMFGDKEIKLEEGSVIVFPSNFMYPHEVKPVKSGVRYSFVSWVW